MARYPSRTTLGDHFSEAARLLWAVVDTKCERNQSTLAEALGADPGLVSRWLYGDRVPGLVWALELERLYGIDPSLWKSKPKRGFVLPGVRLQPTGTEE